VSLADVLHVSAATGEQFNHGFVSGASIIGSVAGNTVLNMLGMLFVNNFRPLELAHFSFLITVLSNFNVFAAPHAGDLHLIFSQGSRLVRADVVGTAHDLARLQLLHFVVILSHPANRVSQGDHDCERQTFWHGDHDDGDSDDEVTDPDLEVGQEQVGRVSLTTE